MTSQLFNAAKFREAMAEIGTPEWADRCRKKMQEAINKEIGAVVDFRDEWMQFVSNKGWELLANADDVPFADYRAFALCKRPHGLGMDTAEFVRHCESAHSATGIDPRDRAELTRAALDPKGGRPPAAEEHSQRLSLATGSNSADRLTARIARDHPDILGRMKAGEFKSVRAAALEAGIVKPTIQVPPGDPVRMARLIQKHASLEVQAELRKALTNPVAVESANEIGELRSAIRSFVEGKADGQPPHIKQNIADLLEDMAKELRK